MVEDKTQIREFVSPRPKLLIEDKGRKLICEAIKLAPEKLEEDTGICTIKILALFDDHITEFIEQLDAELRYIGNGSVNGYTHFREENMAFITLQNSDLNRDLLYTIWRTLKKSDCQPAQRDSDDVMLKEMKYRGLLVNYEDGNISNYTFRVWTGTITKE